MPSSIAKLKKFTSKMDEMYQPLRESMKRIGEIDKECNRNQQIIESLAIPMIKQWTRTKREMRHKQFKAIKNALEKMNELSAEKVKIASQSYETVDNYVVQLDKLSADLIRQPLNQKENEKSKKADGKISKKTRKTILKSPVKVDPGLDMSAYLDMPVDPNEPTYCFCHQVSFGHMVKCDNANCPIEWFHFQCVGLEVEPEGDWFCSVCLEKQMKK